MAEAIRYKIEPRGIQFDGFPVARLLPKIGLNGVGPWLFFDHMGPHDFKVDQGLDVPPHPHINLATVTYLFEGEILHKDSIGNVQHITPGAINLMIAGAGIAHSERGPHALRQSSHSVHGLQLWHGLPEEQEEAAASFHHYPVEDIPATTMNGVHIRLLIGGALGLKSPVRTFARTHYAEYHLRAGQSAAVPEDVEELAVYAVDSKLKVDDEILPPRLADSGKSPYSCRKPYKSRVYRRSISGQAIYVVELCLFEKRTDSKGNGRLEAETLRRRISR